MMPPHKLVKVLRRRVRQSALAIALVGLMSAFGGLVAPSVGSASPPPSGERITANSVQLCCSASRGLPYFSGGGGSVEPAYNGGTGLPIFLFTPNNANLKLSTKIVVDPTSVTFPFPHPVNVAPIFLPVYPAGSGIDPSTLNCAHVPLDNCPDHGPLVAAIANQADNGMYGSGVLGHDHIVGVASSKGDFNIVWEPVLILFTDATAATQHITTVQQIANLLSAHLAFEVPLPPADFQCSIAPAALYATGTPATAI